MSGVEDLPTPQLGVRDDEQLFSVLSRAEAYELSHRRASEQLSRAYLALAEARHLGQLEQIRPAFFAEDKSPAALVSIKAASASMGEGKLPGAASMSLVASEGGDEGWSGVQSQVRSLRRARDEFLCALKQFVSAAREGSALLGEVGAITERGGDVGGGAAATSTSAVTAARGTATFPSSQPRTVSEPWESAMRKKAQTGKGAIVMQMMQQLGAALVVQEDNVKTNEKLWDAYAKNWKPSEPWVRAIAEGNRPESELLRVGDEWSPQADLERVFEDVFRPALHVVREGRLAAVGAHNGGDGVVGGSGVTACEIGSGGGRVARLVAPLVSSLRCFDISKEMLARAKQGLAGTSTSAGTAASFELLRSDVPPERAFAAKHTENFDFVYSFDVFVHLDLHTQASYWRAIRSLLRPAPSSRALVSTANLMSPLGWKRFSRQAKFSVGGFYFTTPEIERKLIGEAGLEIVFEAGAGAAVSASSSLDGTLKGNVYYDRDYIVVVKIKGL